MKEYWVVKYKKQYLGFADKDSAKWIEDINQAHVILESNIIYLSVVIDHLRKLGYSRFRKIKVSRTTTEIK
jgi:hypothetical protein